MKSWNTKTMTFMGLGIAINIIGAWIALTLKLPIFMDSIGTLLVAALFGPVYGMITGLLGSIISGITFDIYSLYFAPVQIFTGLIGGYLFYKGWFKGSKVFIGLLGLSIVTSLVGGAISAFVFGGVTSSGISYVIVVLNKLGVNPIVSAFVCQWIFDYMDKFVAVFLIVTATYRVPKYSRTVVRSGESGSL